MMIYFPSFFRDLYSENTLQKYDGIHKVLNINIYLIKIQN